MKLIRVVAVTFAGACLAILVGFFYFLSQIHAASRITPTRADAIVVFSGEPKRIRVATGLLVDGLGRNLIIVGQDNADEVHKMRLANKALFECCVKIDSRSTNTTEDAKLAKNLLQETHSRSSILVTSSFHMPRAKRELHRQVPGINIIPYGVDDDYYRLGNILTSDKVASAFLSQYILFISSWVPNSRDMLDKNSAREILHSVSNFRNIGLVFLAAAAALIAAFAFSRHQKQRRQFFKRRKL